MKKFLLICAMAMLTYTTSMAAETKVTHEEDIGLCTNTSVVTPFEVVIQNVEAWQAPVTLEMASIKSAHVAFANLAFSQPVVYSKAHAKFKWPYRNSKNIYFNYTSTSMNNAPPVLTSFIAPRTESI